MKMTDNTILVTGGTSGIGRALAEAFHALGNRVIVTGRRRHLLAKIEAAHPGMVGLPLDLDEPDAAWRLAAQLRERFPQLNVLVANAGVSRAEDLAADGWDERDAEQMVATNILGILRVSAAMLPILKKQPNATLIATGSALAFAPRADFPTYCATKAFLHSWLQSVRHQLRHVPVEVLELCPPYVRTELTGVAQAADPRAMPLEAYVDEVMRLLWEGRHPNGELLLEQDLPRRHAEHDGRYAEVFAALNPS